MTIDVAAKVKAARGSLQVARDMLDEAVAELPDDAADNVMATPQMLVLLLRVVAARRSLAGLEILLARTRAT